MICRNGFGKRIIRWFVGAAMSTMVLACSTTTALSSRDDIIRGKIQEMESIRARIIENSIVSARLKVIPGETAIYLIFLFSGGMFASFIGLRLKIRTGRPVFSARAQSYAKRIAHERKHLSNSKETSSGGHVGPEASERSSINSYSAGIAPGPAPNARRMRVYKPTSATHQPHHAHSHETGRHSHPHPGFAGRGGHAHREREHRLSAKRGIDRFSRVGGQALRETLGTVDQRGLHSRCVRCERVRVKYGTAIIRKAAGSDDSRG